MDINPRDKVSARQRLRLRDDWQELYIVAEFPIIIKKKNNKEKQSFQVWHSVKAQNIQNCKAQLFFTSTETFYDGYGRARTEQENYILR